MMDKRSLLPLALGLFALPLVACVSQSTYDAAVADAQKALQMSRASEARYASEAARAKTLEGFLASEQLKSAELQKKIDEEMQKSAELQKKLDEVLALQAALEKELAQKGTDVSALLKEKGQLSRTLEESRRRLEELRKAQAAAEARAALFRDVALKFQRMVDAGALKIALRDGRMVLQLPNDVLFDSGKVDIKPKGKEALSELAAVLKTIPNRHFQIAGHTDNVPIKTARFPSNWELSTARGVEVARFLVAQGVSPEMLSAAGYGEFDPVVSNDSSEGKSKNRRIEITLVPNIEELVSMPK